MKVLVHSYQGDGAPLALRLDDEGHDVSVYFQDPSYRPLLQNLVPHIDDPHTVDEDVDVVLFDMVGNGAMADHLRSEGIAVIGASSMQDLLELDRGKAMALLETAGCTVPETTHFGAGDFAGAIDFIRENPDRYVFKADSNIGNDKTHVGLDADELCEYLEHLDGTIEKEEGKRPPFILQAFVPGVEVSTERWYVDGQPLRAFDNSTFELKKCWNGRGTDAGLGPTVGCAGNIVFPHQDRRLLAQTVDCLDRIAATAGITGPMDLNAIVSEKDHRAYILEVTARFGYDAIQTFAALWQLSFGDTLELLIDHGRVPALGWGCAAGIRVTIPPYPEEEPTRHERTPLLDDVLDDPDVWPFDVAHGEGEALTTAGVNGIVAVVTGTGMTPTIACTNILDGLKKWRTPELQYRTDLAGVVGDRLARLQRWGYLKGMG